MGGLRISADAVRSPTSQVPVTAECLLRTSEHSTCLPMVNGGPLPAPRVHIQAIDLVVGHRLFDESSRSYKVPLSTVLCVNI